MAKAKSNANGRLEESLITLNQSNGQFESGHGQFESGDAAFQANQIAFSARMAESDIRLAELKRATAARFAEVEKRFARIEAILLDHSEILRALPDAVRDKIGIRMPGQKSGE